MKDIIFLLYVHAYFEKVDSDGLVLEGHISVAAAA